MLKKIFSLSFFLLVLLQIGAQDRTPHEVVKALKKMDLEVINFKKASFDTTFHGKILKKRQLFLKYGDLSKIELSDNYRKKMGYLDSILYATHLGEYYSYKTFPDDALAFKNNLIAFEIAKKRGDTLFINESLRQLNTYFLKNYSDQALYKSYVEKLSEYQQDDIDVFWKDYYTLVYDMTFSSFSDTEFKILEKRFSELLENSPNHSYFKGLAYHMFGIFYTYPEQYEKSLEYFELAIETYNRSDYYSYSRKVRTVTAIAAMNFKTGSSEKTLNDFKKLLNNNFVKEDFELKYLIYDWISKIYEERKDMARAKFYLDSSIIAKDSVAYYNYLKKIKDISLLNDVKNKNEEIQQLAKQKSKLQKNFYTILPILGIVTAILAITFLLYRRYKNRNIKLEDEKSETLQKLDELKNIVIKNHIILKDKTKVYISDLMYIKSEDHYLKIFTSDGKNHFVRGKLSSIKEELPPNFIQCHRSYIVNSNFIKRANSDTIFLIDKTQIPLSRSFKSRFRK